MLGRATVEKSKRERQRDNEITKKERVRGVRETEGASRNEIDRESLEP